MKKTNFLAAGLIAAMMVPAVAQAQTREIREDRREVREERREYNQALRHGDRHDIREERREYNDARRDLRESKRDWRRDHRYQNYRAPFRYQQFRVGATLRPSYYAPAYRIGYDRRWGVPQAGRNLVYVRHYNDLLLVNVRNGKVVRVYHNHFRWR
ncbi:RcnB family protein [Sphingopyxis sp. DHUNG17]|uniref:RcnB family protein n=1 Tax=Sphingopyxis jiangsuensis TaxID=2871171 RepID=UPI00191F18C8|nr:RcnB family protein [Sphingopyxis lutea]MBL0767284.1 RcnB family protein [Sphingopyxis lutea]